MCLISLKQSLYICGVLFVNPFIVRLILIITKINITILKLSPSRCYFKYYCIVIVKDKDCQIITTVKCHGFMKFLPVFMGDYEIKYTKQIT